MKSGPVLSLLRTFNWSGLQLLSLFYFIYRLGDQATQINKTTTKPGTQNPLFQEILTFDLVQADLVDAKLIIGVWNKDSISQDDFLGETILKLYREEVNGGVAMWHKLKPHVSCYVNRYMLLFNASIAGNIFIISVLISSQKLSLNNLKCARNRGHLI